MSSATWSGDEVKNLGNFNPKVIFVRTVPGITVITVIPGTVRTKMTFGLKLPKFFTSSPDQVAEDIFVAVKKKKNIIYTMGIWRLIMFIIKCIPEEIFKIKSL